MAKISVENCGERSIKAKNKIVEGLLDAGHVVYLQFTCVDNSENIIQWDIVYNKKIE